MDKHLTSIPCNTPDGKRRYISIWERHGIPMVLDLYNAEGALKLFVINELTGYYGALTAVPASENIDWKTFRWKKYRVDIAVDNEALAVVLTAPSGNAFAHHASYQPIDKVYGVNEYHFARVDPTIPVQIGSYGEGSTRSLLIKPDFGDGDDKKWNPDGKIYPKAIEIPGTTITIEGVALPMVQALLKKYKSTRFAQLPPGKPLGGGTRNALMQWMKGFEE